MALNCGEYSGFRVESAADGLRKLKSFDRKENYRCSGDAGGKIQTCGNSCWVW
jgi:hypothetical protein